MDSVFELMESRYVETRQKIKHNYQKNKKSIDASFLEIVKQLLQEGIEKQKKGEKNKAIAIVSSKEIFMPLFSQNNFKFSSSIQSSFPYSVESPFF